MAGIKLISLNIERSKHLDFVLPFLEREKADVVCIQELMDYDIPALEQAAGGQAFYIGTTRHPAEDREGMFGIGMFSRSGFLDTRARFYHGTGIPDKLFDFTNQETKYNSESHAVALGDIEKDGVSFRIATTHFTWTPDGQPSDFQRQDMRKMLDILANVDEMALAGDFNAPRGGEIFSQLAARYRDNIPEEYTTSIDGALHRAGDLERMVDGLFTTPGYRASDVKLVGGVSDHMAIVATINSLQ